MNHPTGHDPVVRANIVVLCRRVPERQGLSRGPGTQQTRATAQPARRQLRRPTRTLCRAQRPRRYSGSRWGDPRSGSRIISFIGACAPSVRSTNASNALRSAGTVGRCRPSHPPPGAGCGPPVPAGIAGRRVAGRVRRVDRVVVVDEVQDLTLLGDRRRRRVVPGDRAPAGTCAVAAGGRRRRADGASVGFRLGRVERPVAVRPDAPRRFHLEDNLRCPRCIAAVIERASQWYVHLDKSRRPTKQRQQQGGQHVDAHLLSRRR